jgi:hypothetical protein
MPLKWKAGQKRGAAWSDYETSGHFKIIFKKTLKNIFTEYILIGSPRNENF